mgnify:CR=1 FL=1
MLKHDWTETWYDFLELMVIIGGLTGKLMVWIGMLAGCILLWYFVFAFIKAGT